MSEERIYRRINKLDERIKAVQQQIDADKAKIESLRMIIREHEKQIRSWMDEIKGIQGAALANRMQKGKLSLDDALAAIDLQSDQNLPGGNAK